MMQTLPLSPAFSSPSLAMIVVQLKPQGDHTGLSSNVHLEVATMEVPPCFTDSTLSHLHAQESHMAQFFSESLPDPPCLP